MDGIWLFLILFLIFITPGLIMIALGMVWDLVADKVSPVLDWILSEGEEEARRWWEEETGRWEES